MGCALRAGMHVSPEVVPCGRRLPRNATILGLLRERGVRAEPDAGEAAEAFEARVETALMALFRDRRGEAEFQALYEYTSAALLAWITSLASGRRTSADPLEILQDGYVSIYRYAGTFRDDHARSFRVWSRTIASNLLRRSRPRAGQLALQAMPEGLQEPVDARGGPSELLSLGEERRALLLAWMLVLSQYVAAWQRLPPRDRIALDLIEVQGLSYAEAGARLGVGLSNMKMIMFRARKRIRAAIEIALLRGVAAGRRIAV